MNKDVVALVYDGLCTFEFGIVAEIFGLPRPELKGVLATDWYQFKSVSLEKGRLQALGGLSFTSDGKLSDVRAAGTIIIPGWRGIHVPVPERMCQELRVAHHRGARIVSICSGVFVLAAAGLLDNRQATTHWRYVRDLELNYPNIHISPDALYVDEGDILTSAGSAAGIDLCLHIVRCDFGAKIANIVARRLVIHAHRQGGQAQFIQQPVPVQHEAHRLSAIIDYIRSHLNVSHNIVSLADQAGMSKRTFHRRFVAYTGMAPLQWINSERMVKACALLEETDASLLDIANTVGLKNTETLQYHFRNRFNMSPSSYRKRFSCT